MKKLVIILTALCMLLALGCGCEKKAAPAQHKEKTKISMALLRLTSSAPLFIAMDKGFFEEEIAYRDLMMYPPVANMMAILVLSNDELTGMARANELVDVMKRLFREERLSVIGPASASIGKINDIYRSIIYVKHRDYAMLVRVKDEMEALIAQKGWNADAVQFDFNPMSAY